MGDQSDLLDAIRQLAQAEIETQEEIRRQNKLTKKSLDELIRLRAAEEQRRRLAFDTQDMVTGLITALREVFSDIAFIKQRAAEFDRRSERTDDILLLLLTENNPDAVTEMISDMKADIGLRESEQRELLRTHRRNLAYLRQQAAFQGHQVKLDLMNQIEAEQQIIEVLEKQLGYDEPGVEFKAG